MPLHSEFADAFPRKRFFVEMFTRDIALEDCILDLVDNSIDSLIRSREIDVEDVLGRQRRPTRPAQIDVIVTPKQISVDDNCGGIPLLKAQHEVFNFGHSKEGARDLTERGLGAYGIGLKRAIFKMGKTFQVDSTENGTGFRVTQDLEKWIRKDSSIEDWRFPIESMSAAALECPRHGTRVKVTDLQENIKLLAKSPDFLDNLNRAISKTYAYFIPRHAAITLNGEVIPSTELPIGSTEEYKPAIDTYEDDGVRVRLRAGLAPRAPGGKWEMERAGWYVLCNGRIVVSADKTHLTGWGAGILPQFHSSKGRGFVGLALFASSDPLKLPWTTTKRGLNRESPVYLKARNRMQSVARPVYTYLESLYSSGDDATAEEREAAKKVTQANQDVVFTEAPSSFRPAIPRRRSDLVSVQFKVASKKLDAVRGHLARPWMSAGDIGRYTLDYFMRNEEIS
jgi:hypothetical protein